MPHRAFRRRLTKTVCRKTSGTEKAFAESLGYPVVVKADGLAQGKGVVIAESRDEAVRAIDSMFAGAFGTAGDELVIEEFLDGAGGEPVALRDGEHILPLAGAQDHKRAFDGDHRPEHRRNGCLFANPGAGCADRTGTS